MLKLFSRRTGRQATMPSPSTPANNPPSSKLDKKGNPLPSVLTGMFKGFKQVVSRTRKTDKVMSSPNEVDIDHRSNSQTEQRQTPLPTVSSLHPTPRRSPVSTSQHSTATTHQRPTKTMTPVGLPKTASPNGTNVHQTRDRIHSRNQKASNPMQSSPQHDVQQVDGVSVNQPLATATVQRTSKTPAPASVIIPPKKVSAVQSNADVFEHQDISNRAQKTTRPVKPAILQQARRPGPVLFDVPSALAASPSQPTTLSPTDPAATASIPSQHQRGPTNPPKHRNLDRLPGTSNNVYAKEEARAVVQMVLDQAADEFDVPRRRIFSGPVVENAGTQREADAYPFQDRVRNREHKAPDPTMSSLHHPNPASTSKPSKTSTHQEPSKAVAPACSISPPNQVDHSLNNADVCQQGPPKLPQGSIRTQRRPARWGPTYTILPEGSLRSQKRPEYWGPTKLRTNTFDPDCETWDYQFDSEIEAQRYSATEEDLKRASRCRRVVGLVEALEPFFQDQEDLRRRKDGCNSSSSSSKVC
ncbi:hypothetical protein FRC01_000897 [Tulasnella sp. 417]|nr:hypothetical protein FRC01_000897 [Tulasnella sp. 417]